MSRRWIIRLTVLPVAIFLLAAGCSKPPANLAGVTLDTRLARLIPSGTHILAGADVTRLRAAPFYQQHPKFDAWAERAGLNPQRDLSKILVAWSGSRRFFLAERRSPSGMKIMTDGAVSTTRGGLTQELKQQLGELGNRDQVWIVSTNGLPLMLMPKRSDIRSALSNIAAAVTGTSIGLSIDTGIRLHANLTCVSDAAAEHVRDALRGGIALLRFTSRDRELQHLYAAIAVDQNHSHVTMQANLSPQASTALVRYLAPMMSGSRVR